jgi:hypothetical protein
LDGDAESVFLRDNFKFFIISIFISCHFSGETNRLTNKGFILGATLLLEVSAAASLTGVGVI